MMVFCSITAAHFRCLHTAYSSTIQPYSTETLPSESLLATVEGAKLRLGTCVMRQVSTKKKCLDDVIILTVTTAYFCTWNT